jgi:hypothetical protein
MRNLRNGTYLREPDGATRIYFSPYSFNDPAESFRKRQLYDDGWNPVVGDEESLLWELCDLQPGEYVFIRGGKALR